MLNRRLIRFTKRDCSEKMERDWCRRLGVRKITNASTGAAFGGQMPEKARWCWTRRWESAIELHCAASNRTIAARPGLSHHSPHRFTRSEPPLIPVKPSPKPAVQHALEGLVLRSILWTTRAGNPLPSCLPALFFSTHVNNQKPSDVETALFALSQNHYIQQPIPCVGSAL